MQRCFECSWSQSTELGLRWPGLGSGRSSWLEYWPPGTTSLSLHLGQFLGRRRYGDAVLRSGRPRRLRRVLDGYDVFVAPPLPPVATAGVRARWIVDLYNPEPFEGLSHGAGQRHLERRVRTAARIDRVVVAARHGASFICASERQRDMWLGFLAASRRLDPAMYLHDPDLRTLIDVVPFGLPRLPAERRGEGLRGSVFPQDARIMVWNGGLWDWFDPETVIEAVVRLRLKDASWRLAFSGIGRPSHRARMRTSQRVLSFVAELDPADQEAIHFREWTPYRDRAAPLLDADIGVSAHRASLEARFAHGTRILDLVWTHTPILCTAGDEWSEIVVAEGLGEAVPPGDPDALADAAWRIADRGRAAYARAFEASASGRSWGRCSRLAPWSPRQRGVQFAASAGSRQPHADASSLLRFGGSAGGAPRTRVARTGVTPPDSGAQADGDRVVARPGAAGATCAPPEHPGACGGE